MNRVYRGNMGAAARFRARFAAPPPLRRNGGFGKLETRRFKLPEIKIGQVRFKEGFRLFVGAELRNLSLHIA